jgi:hypothetical protein
LIARVLTEPSLPVNEVTQSRLEPLLQLLDYGWLSGKEDATSNFLTTLATGFGDWALFDGFVGMDNLFAFSPQASNLGYAFDKHSADMSTPSAGTHRQGTWLDTFGTTP